MKNYKITRASVFKTTKSNLGKFNTPDNILIGTGVIMIVSASINPFEIGNVIGVTGVGMITSGILEIVANKRIEEVKQNKNK